MHPLAQIEDIDFTNDLVWVAIAVGLVVAVLIVVRILGGGRRPPQVEQEELRIDLDKLGTAGPPASGPVVELYNTPMRLAAVIVAPMGRGGAAPEIDRVPELIDQVAPGLERVIDHHRPAIRCWPNQLSAEGFVHTLFAKLSLPGDRGKGTPWSVVAGRATADDEKLLIGLVLRSAKANNLGQLIVEREGQWLDMLRVK